jgi:tetratricopeptide (TPR) repeat protein
MIEKLLSLYEKGRLCTMPDPKPKSEIVAFCRNILSETNLVMQDAGTSLRSDLLFKLTALYNRAALVHYQLGNYNHAVKLCWKAITMCGEAETSGAKAWYLAVLQPYVNVARLLSAEGDWGRALAMLDEVRRFAENRAPLQLGDYVLPPCSEYCTEAECREIVNFARTVFITDSLRALLMADQYGELADFTETWLNTELANNSDFWMMLKESSARAALLLGRHQHALAVISEMIATMKSTSRLYPSIYCLVADIYMVQGRYKESIQLLSRIDSTYGRALVASGKHSAAFNFLSTLSLAEIKNGLYERAGANAKMAVELAQRMEDEGGKLRAMALLACALRLGKDKHLNDETKWHATFCNSLLNSYHRLERVIGCSVASECSRILDNYIEAEHGRLFLARHALTLCDAAPVGIFKAAAALIRSAHLEPDFSRPRLVLNRADLLFHPIINEIYDWFMSLQIPAFTKNRVTGPVIQDITRSTA